MGEVYEGTGKGLGGEWECVWRGITGVGAGL